MLPDKIDVAIVGGGLAGMSTAWALARRGILSIVLEREPELGRYASGRGAGLGRQLAEDDDTTALTIRGAAALRTELAAAWTPSGGILSFDRDDALEAYVARARRTGVAAEVIDADAIRARWPALDRLAVVGGLAIASDGLIDAPGLLRLYAARAGVALGVTVERIAPGGQGVEVLTSRGRVETRVVVDAGGAWAGALTGDPPLEAYKRHLFVLEAAPAAHAPYLWHLGSRELYVRPHADGVLACACDAVLGAACDAQPDASGEEALHAILADVAPSLAQANLARRWACQRSFTPDRRMRLGRDPARPWLVWAAGLGGHGATASAAVGEDVAAAVVAALA